MAERIRLKQAATDAGFDDPVAWLHELSHDTICPALCSEGCTVELDGSCPHGFPSPFIAAGLI